MAAFLQLTLHFGQTLQGGQVRAAGIQGSLSSPRGRAFSRVPPSGPSTADWEVTCPGESPRHWHVRDTVRGAGSPWRGFSAVRGLCLVVHTREGTAIGAGCS